MDKTISILGSGTYGEVILELAVQLGYKVRYFYDDDLTKIGEKCGNIVVKDTISNLLSLELRDQQYVIAIGNNLIRSRIAKKLKEKGAFLITLIHPRAELCTSSKIGEGCIIHANSFVWSKCVIDSFSIISPGVVIAHHTKIGECSFVSAGSNVGAGIEVNELSFIGIGSTLMTGVKTIGRNSYIGAGSVIIKDVPDNAVVVGNPGRIIKYKHD